MSNGNSLEEMIERVSGADLRQWARQLQDDTLRAEFQSLVDSADRIRSAKDHLAKLNAQELERDRIFLDEAKSRLAVLPKRSFNALMKKLGIEAKDVDAAHQLVAGMRGTSDFYAACKEINKAFYRHDNKVWKQKFDVIKQKQEISIKLFSLQENVIDSLLGMLTPDLRIHIAAVPMPDGSHGLQIANQEAYASLRVALVELLDYHKEIGHVISGFDTTSQRDQDDSE